MLQDFIANPIIRTLAAKPYWTVNIDGKKPLDILEFDQSGLIRGAKDEQCLTDLSNLLRITNSIPKQFVYHLNAVRDNYVVLDIEKTCPDDIKNNLLKLPFLYGDISMSGNGLHLVLPCPALDELTVNKIAMKEEHGYYEILLHHYVTFTHYTILPQFTDENSPVSFVEVWNKLKQTQRNTVKHDFDTDIANVSLDFPQREVIEDAVIANFKNRYTKTPDDFHNDMSRYEFAVIGSIRYSLKTVMSFPIFARSVQLDEMQQIAMVYNIVSKILPHRKKHEELRDGKPMLLYQVLNSFATTISS